MITKPEQPVICVFAPLTTVLWSKNGKNRQRRSWKIQLQTVSVCTQWFCKLSTTWALTVRVCSMHSVMCDKMSSPMLQYSLKCVFSKTALLRGALSFCEASAM